jgi:hypothetical protein
VNQAGVVHFKDGDHHIIHSEGQVDYLSEDSIMNQAEQT